MNTPTVSIMTGEETAALSYLPDRLAEEVKKHAALYGGMINEIRLRSEGVLSITIMGENVICKTTVSEKECVETFMRLCRNSLYSHADTLKEGYITTPEGIRAGVCGRAVCENGVVTAVAGATAICIRIPRRIPGAGDVAYEVLKDMNFDKGLIIWSRPGVGKTTLLRELTARLGGGGEAIRVCVVDTRHEIGAGISRSGLIDVLDGYPRSKGIEIAKRTMSPQLIICDEIGTADDAAAILDAAGSGIPIVASAHAGSLEELRSQRHLKPIISSECMGAYIGLLGQTNGGYEHEIYRCSDKTEMVLNRQAR